jgi:hypothetical protein
MRAGVTELTARFPSRPRRAFAPTEKVEAWGPAQRLEGASLGMHFCMSTTETGLGVAVVTQGSVSVESPPRKEFRL